ncbi:MAG: pilus assembly protein PilP [Gammaproteobacteria bacterium]|nr:pilus assembly protein PilP [Gammaproteobacteria bacterium]NIR82226.1 pilus assembly protein PilP [Gammaproteobacteria bacterium]NIR90825.1 pilus assembly protein PilP [Gammaproteobacteria bacterium]NIU03376.1 pilus assembly protein PilP [Gammaproteobacteria bacterium]NIV50872.1 pilus assembly protein PilP [Gammaproteobacteria bacterium]
MAFGSGARLIVDEKNSARRGALSGAHRIVSLGLCLVLAACGGDSMRDLREYAAEVNARKSTRVEPLPDFKRYETYAYQSSDKVDPFEPFFQEDKVGVAETRPNSGLQPDIERNKEELEAFPLDSLRMVGTLEQDDVVWGIIKDPEGVVHRVQVGNYMGQNYGKIMHIQEDRIELLEIVRDGQGGWVENEAAVALAE